MGAPPQEQLLALQEKRQREQKEPVQHRSEKLHDKDLPTEAEKELWVSRVTFQALPSKAPRYRCCVSFRAPDVSGNPF
ncbi:hypothetical protein GN956_G5057 [Arapaima gigas]